MQHDTLIEQPLRPHHSNQEKASELRRQVYHLCSLPTARQHGDTWTCTICKHAAVCQGIARAVGCLSNLHAKHSSGNGPVKCCQQWQCCRGCAVPIIMQMDTRQPRMVHVLMCCMAPRLCFRCKELSRTSSIRGPCTEPSQHNGHPSYKPPAHTNVCIERHERCCLQIKQVSSCMLPQVMTLAMKEAMQCKGTLTPAEAPGWQLTAGLLAQPEAGSSSCFHALRPVAALSHPPGSGTIHLESYNGCRLQDAQPLLQQASAKRDGIKGADIPFEKALTHCLTPQQLSQDSYQGSSQHNTHSCL